MDMTSPACGESSCFPPSPPEQGPSGSGPTSAPGASMLHATAWAPTLRRVGQAGSLLGMPPVVPWQGLRQGKVHVPQPRSGTSPAAARAPPCATPSHPHGLITPADRPTPAPARVRTPASPPEPLLFAPSVLWALPSPFGHLLLFIQTV